MRPVGPVPSSPQGPGLGLRSFASARVVVVHVTTVPISLRAHLSGQGRFMRSRGFEVHAITSPGPEAGDFSRREGVEVETIAMRRAITPAADLAALWKLWRALRRLHPHIVHSHTPKGGLLGMIAGILSGAPVRIYHLRGLPFVTASGFRRQLLRASERASCLLAHRVLAVSESMRSIAVEEGFCPPEKIKVLLGGSGNGVDAEGRFRPRPEAARLAARRERDLPSDARVIGFVGRLGPEKGSAELLSAWKALREREPRLHLLLVGPDEGLTRAQCEALRRDPRVRLTGHVGDAAPMYPAMDVVALPTYREGFPNVALEAAAMALPIVATDVPGCRDAVVHGETGTLVPARDALALERALERYLEDPALRARHGAAARKRVLSDFRREAIWDAIALEYRTLLAARGALPLDGDGLRPAPAATPSIDRELA
jgi:glycosyltransferase involved in cell wall biosynthesis